MALQTRARHMPPHITSTFESELRRARSATSLDERWAALERAHILSQPWPTPHVRAHGAMVRLAIHQRDIREIAGQLLRLIVAGPASAIGRYPTGNTGRARVPATLPMPLPDDLAELLGSAP